MSEGWVKLHRKVLDSRVFSNPEMLQLWVYCLCRANHKKTYVDIKTGRGKSEIKVEPGQYIFGRKSVARDLNMNPSTLYKRMKKLEDMGNLSIKSNSHYSVVSICNWDTYQDVENGKEQASNNQGTGKEQASNTDKNDNNVKNEKNNTTREENFLSLLENVETHEEAFEIWNKYRKKKGKHANLYEKEVLIKKEWRDMSPKEVAEAILYTVKNGWVTLQYPEEDQKPENEPVPQYLTRRL